MSDTDTGENEIVVTIEPDLEQNLLGGTGAGDGTVVRKENTDPLGDLKEQFNALQSTLSTTQQTLNQTAQERDELARTAKELEVEVVTTRKDSVEQGIAAAKADGDAAEKEYAKAMEDGDFAAAARAQRRMAAAESTILKLSDAKDDLEVVTKPAPRQTQQRTEAPAVVDKTEAYISRFTPASQAWLRSHKDYVTDPAKNSQLLTAHHAALGQGYAADTPEYFAAVEKKLGIGAPPSSGRRPIPPVAPASPTGGGMNGNASNEVRLSPKEALAATDGTHTWPYDDPKGRFKKGEPIGVQEFARRKMIMKQQGMYDRTLTE